MKQRNVAELITINGNRLLSGLYLRRLYDQPVYMGVDLYKCVNDYNETALLYQIRKEMEEKGLVREFSEKMFRKILLFVDFRDFFQGQDTGRNALFEELLKTGFTAQWPGSDEVITYVPFEKSQSQAKHCVISFIQKDLFLPVRKRLDLDIGFGDYNAGDLSLGFPLKNPVPQLSKLYAYRGLYLTDAVRLDGLKELLQEDRIVVLKEVPDDVTTACPVYTANEDKGANKDYAVLTESLLAKPGKDQSTDPFDGVGLISPRGAALFNRALDPETFAAADIDPENTNTEALFRQRMAVSFQFRLPFCKGMLHTVDFHRFFRQECALTEDLWVEDAFGVQRNLKNADIILNQTLFKLYGMLREVWKDPLRSKEFIRYYFKKLEEYDHSFYIAETDRQLHRTGFARLTAQIINTLPFRQEEFDRLVARHTQRAMEYQLTPILHKEGKSAVLDDESSELLHKIIKADYRLALDSYVEGLIDSCRKQALNRLFLGKLDVEGDMRFLCRDLIYYLSRISHRLHSEKKITYFPRGYVYLPGVATEQRCALFRSPHLCPNENVAALTHRGTSLHRKYLNHLHRVAFVSGNSQMPDALGGADFDGDMAVIAFQQEVVDACYRKCYREDFVDMPLIRIPSLEPSRFADRTRHLCGEDSPYVDIHTIQNTFNSRIGIISNATMKLCAAAAIDGDSIPYSGAYCAILNGVEIDAAKSGRRPYLNDVVSFSSDPGDRVSPHAAEAMEFVRTYLRNRENLKSAKQNFFTIEEDGGNYIVKRGGEKLAAFSKTSEGKPFVYQLLCRWAEALQSRSSEEQSVLKTEAVEKLRSQLLALVTEGEDPTFSKTQYNYPRKEVLTQLVFRCDDFSASQYAEGIKALVSTYEDVKTTLNDLQDNTDEEKGRTLRQRLLYLLQYKYDNIDQTVDGQPTLRQMGNAMSTQLGIKLTTPEDITNLLTEIFYCQEDLGKNWLFQSPESRQALLDELLDPRTAQITNRFDSHGYDLLYFALRELLVEKDADRLHKTVETHMDDSFRDTLIKEATAAMDDGRSAAYISDHLLPSLCRKELEAIVCTQDTDILIPLVYGCAKASHRTIVWKMFTWPEIEAYLKKVSNNAQ